jgi:elongation factor 3
MGFDTDKQAQGVQELSGGWRMRLALAQAMLSEMDVLCLDEPTNHLDTKSVNWLQAYLADLGHVTLVVVSHEPSFLDAVVTDMLHICEQELTAHPGTFTEFLTNTGATLESLHITEVSAELHFPEPEKLMNVAPTQAVLKLANVDFAYTKGGPTVLHDITCKLMLISRCAVIGDNGAGKSTLIKLLVGEHLASKGMCWRHHNMRVAYVAQHTFFHLEDHLQDTAIHYLQHRFQAGNDSESPVVKAGSAMAKEVVSGEKPLGRDEWGKIAEFRLDSLVGRRKYKKEVEYEVHYKDRKDKTNKWVPQSELRSWGKHANQLMADFDEEMRMREAGVDSRAINPTEVEAHFESFGLKASISNSKIEELSGGQRARLVLAAAMWNKPHLIVLDEPTNFLDEEALKALGNAIGEFKGAVIMVSHHEDFVTRLCSEVWRVTDGRLVVEQKTYDSKTAAYSNVTPER